MDEMKNMHAVSDENLEVVTGGDVTIGNCRLSGRIGADGGVVGQWYYIVEKDNSNTWYYGRLSRTKDVEVGWFNASHRVYFIDVTERNGEPLHWSRDFSADNVTLYTTMDKI